MQIFECDAIPKETDGPDEPLVIARSVSRLTIAVGVWIAAMFWNGISWTIAYFIYRDGHWFGLAFIGLFLLIGLALFLASIYATLQLFNPECTLVCSQSRLYAGSEIEISWTHQGNVGRIEELTITLQGSEEATFVQGTTSRTESSFFYQSKLVQTKDRSEINEGFRVFSLPDPAMHSFKSKHNTIQWELHTHGKIAMWPDVNENFPLTIYPPSLNAKG